MQIASSQTPHNSDSFSFTAGLSWFISAVFSIPQIFVYHQDGDECIAHWAYPWGAKVSLVIDTASIVRFSDNKWAFNRQTLQWALSWRKLESYNLTKIKAFFNGCLGFRIGSIFMEQSYLSIITG